MFDLLPKLFRKERTGSRDIALERLRLALVHDRVNVSPQMMEGLRQDMIHAISNYMEVDAQDVAVNLTQTGSSQVALVASIPVSRVKKDAPRE
jgi:cell division topological specificity factor